MGMTPDRLVNPAVGLIPTTELADDGQRMEPSVSDPNSQCHCCHVGCRRNARAQRSTRMGFAERRYGFCNYFKHVKFVIRVVCYDFYLVKIVQLIRLKMFVS
jgi:hypothetical protein